MGADAALQDSTSRAIGSVPTVNANVSASVALIASDKAAIPNNCRLLLVYSTAALNTGMKFEGAEDSCRTTTAAVRFFGGRDVFRSPSPARTPEL